MFKNYMFKWNISVGNNLSFTLTKNNPTLEYISEGQPLFLKLIFEVELDLSYYAF